MAAALGILLRFRLRCVASPSYVVSRRFIQHASHERIDQLSTAPRRPKATEYSVGWICALPIELAAAKAMLDEQYAGPPHDDHDPNLYTLGRIGSHNVVITCLPAGRMGIGPAAVGAAQMLSKFSSIRFGLMVGVGGGVPSAEADIRLGDVVVSQPFKQHGGVVQYDYGKRGSNGQITRIGSLSPPPKVLLNGVSQLRANQHLKASSMAKHLAIFNQLPGFSRDAAGIDVLFEAAYSHSGGASCEECNKEKIVHRKKRESAEQVVIHYGTIASGNQVMKDGITRDQLSAELGGVLCFEMEAAGLMNDLPCLVVRGICDYSDSHKNKTWQPYAAATAAACTKEILSLIPAAEVAETEVAETEAAVDACKYNIPFSLKGVPVGKFADRPRDTAELERVLLPQQPSGRKIIVIHGLGGMGKTQLAADFARRYQRTFSAVLWLDGRSEQSLKQSLATFASRIPVGQISEESRMYTSKEGGDIDAVVEDVLGWLNIPENGNWLMVVNNVDRDYRGDEDTEAYDITTYLPEADHGSVLVTTRLPHLGQLGAQWEVRKVDKDHARAIFEIWYGKPVGQESDVLIDLLDGLPLALAQAAAYMNENMMSFDAYTRLYKEQWKELMEAQDERRAPLRNYADGSVVTTWMISFTAIRARSEAAANLVLLWAHLDNKSFWYGLLAAASQQSNIVAERTSVWIGEIACKEIEFIKAIGILRSYSLVESMEDQTGYAMHPVVHQWALHIQDNTQQAALAWVTVTSVGLAIPMRDTEKYWELHARLLPHVERCKKLVKTMMSTLEEQKSGWQKEDEALLWAIHNLGILYVDLGRGDKAEEMYQWVLQGYEKAWGPGHASISNIVNNLGSIYVGLGKINEVEEMYQRALRGNEKAFGPKHLSTLITVGNLGNLYKHLGKMDKAEEMYQRALQVKEQVWGPEHPLTLSTVYDLGNFYRRLGKINKAEEMFQWALRGFEKAWGPEHTSTLDAVSGLGIIYSDLGKWDEAEEMCLRALRGYENAWGPEHPSTLATANNLGVVYIRQSRVDVAEEMCQRALRGHEKIWGPEHPSTLSTVNDLATLYRNLGKMDEAEEMFQRVIRGYRKVWGPEHMLTLEVVTNLGVVYTDLGRLDEAEEICLRTLQVYENVWPEHPSIFSIANSLGYIYLNQGRMDVAEKMFHRALRGCEKAWGPEHTSTLGVVSNLGLLYTLLGRMDESEKMFLRALRGFEKAIGVDRILSYMPALSTIWGIASFFIHLDRFEDAKIWTSRALFGYEKVLGYRHPKCQTLRQNLAYLDEKIGIANPSRKDALVGEHAYPKAITDSDTTLSKPASKLYKVLQKFGWKQKQA